MTQLRNRLQSSLGGSYTIEKELGGGGMSRVFVAEESALRRRVVVKVLPPELTGVVSAERFKREVLLSARLQHPHIVPVLTAGEIEGIPYYTMPFVEGESLRARIERGPLPIAEVVTCLRDVCKALAYAHGRGVVHRDIKPENILLNGESAAVADFGVAKAIAAARTGDPPDSDGLTQRGVLVGTPAYMAPEQAAADPAVDHRADLYAVGCVAYELLTGGPPFVRHTRQELVAAHLADVPADVRERRPDTPEPLARIVMQCLEKTAAARPQLAFDLAHALDTIATGRNPLLAGGSRALRNALLVYAGAGALTLFCAWLATWVIGLPPWVFPSAVVVTTLGLPIVLAIAYLQRVSGRRLAMIGGGAVAVFVLVVAGWMGLRAAGIGPYGSLLASGKLRTREVLLLTDFQVSNADSALGRVMSDAVRAGLSESTVLSLASQDLVADALRRMRREPMSRMDLALAREIALREGMKAIVDGDLTKVDGAYILTLRLVTADSGAVLATTTATGDGPRGLIEAADEASRKLRARAGESLRRVNASTPLVRATTGSLDALRKYSEAHRANVNRDYPRATRLAREAVALDSTFASAWRLLGNTLVNSAYPVESIDSAYARAYALRERTSPPERLAIESYYFRSTVPPRDRPKAEDVLRRQIEAGEDATAPNALGNLYLSRRDWRAADSLFAMAARSRSPTAVFAFGNRVGLLAVLGRYPEAESVFATLRRRNPAAASRTVQQYFALYYRGEIDQLQKRVDSLTASANPQLQVWAWYMKARLAQRGGRLRESRVFWQRGIAADQQRGVSVDPLAVAIVESDADAVIAGDVRRAATRLDSAVAALSRIAPRLPIPDRTYLELASAFARADRPDRARDVLARYQQVAVTSMRRRLAPWYHGVLGEIALAERRYRDALAGFRRGDSLPDGPANSCAACLPMYLARTFDRAGQRDSAIAMYERYLTVPSLTRFTELQDALWLAHAHDRLGVLYEAAGDRNRAAAHDRAFIALWSHADPELQPRVTEARRRLARLK